MAALAPSNDRKGSIWRRTRLDPVLNGLGRVESSLGGVLGVADHAGGASDEGVRRVAGLLEPLGRDDLDQVAHVQARRGRVEADIELDAALGEGRAERVQVGGVSDEPTPFEIVDQIGHVKPFTLMAAGMPHQNAPSVPYVKTRAESGSYLRRWNRKSPEVCCRRSHLVSWARR